MDQITDTQKAGHSRAKVLNDLRNRGVQDILIAVVDGLKGFPQAIEAAFSQTQVQTCIVHLLRHSMSFASYKDRKAVAVALKMMSQLMV